jgi:hypothetical protein
MELSVDATVDYAAAVANASQYGARLRVMQVANLASYANTTTPQVNLTAAQPWTRASGPGSYGISALCFYIGLQAMANGPAGLNVGLISTNWGGTAIQVWMSPKALQQCKNASDSSSSSSTPLSPEEVLRAGLRPEASARERSLAAMAAARIAMSGRDGIYPAVGSCLYYSMIAPLQVLPIRASFWLQGEANAGDPVAYQCQLPAMIADWRASWAAVGSDPMSPFHFTQIAAWPNQETGLIATMREAMAKIENPAMKIGMSVSVDFSDPAGALHPIHPPWKYEVARRAWMWLDNVVYGNASSPISGPVVTNVSWDMHDSSWGDYHLGYGGLVNVCGSPPFVCAGIRLSFSSPVRMRNFFNPVPYGDTLSGQDAYGFLTGASNGFELLYTNPANANVTWFQPVSLTSISPDGLTVQLNVTWINPSGAPPQTLRYAWNDYPTAMPLVGAGNLPVGPFNVSIPA